MKECECCCVDAAVSETMRMEKYLDDTCAVSPNTNVLARCDAFAPVRHGRISTTDALAVSVLDFMTVRKERRVFLLVSLRLHLCKSLHAPRHLASTLGQRYELYFRG